MIQKSEIEPLVREMRCKMIGTVLMALLIMGLISTALIWRYGSWTYAGSFISGALLGTLNGAVGFLTIERFIDKSNIEFMKGIFLGMGIRLLLLLGIFIILIKGFDLNVVPLVTGLLIFYFAMAGFEIVFLNKRIKLSGRVGEMPQ